MKKSFTLILIVYSTLIFGQADREILFNELDSTAIVPIEKLRVVDMWAKRGVECVTYITKLDSLTNLIEVQSKYHDTIISGIRTNLELVKEENLKIIKDANDAKIEMKRYYLLSQSLQKNLDECRRRETLNLWGNIGMGAAMVGVCAAVIITSRRR